MAPKPRRSLFSNGNLNPPHQQHGGCLRPRHSLTSSVWCMMATVRASCPQCGDVEFSSTIAQLRVCEDNGVGSYSFTCPGCQTVVVKNAEPRVVDLLSGAGVPVVMWRMPDDVDRVHDGDPFTHDDLINFHELLNDDAALMNFFSERG